MSLRALYHRIKYDPKVRFDRIALSALGSARRILDVGCGEGRLAALAPDRVIGLDRSVDNLKANPNPRLIRGNALVLPFADASLDAVHCAHLIEHLMPPDAHRLLAEIDRVLRPGGVFVLQTPLLHPGFFDDFTHLKPYTPRAVMRYLPSGDVPQRTLNDIPGRYEKVRLVYRYQTWLMGLVDTPLAPLAGLFNLLGHLRVFSPKRTGYLLVLRKAI